MKDEDLPLTLSFISGVVILLAGIVVNYQAIELVGAIIMIMVFFSRSKS